MPRQPGFRYLLLALGILLAAVQAGRVPAPGRLVLLDAAGRLDPSRVEAAAKAVLERGATVAVFVVPHGDERGEEFTRLLREAGLAQGGTIAPRALGIYVSFAPRYSELRAGSDWSGRLPRATLRGIRQDALNPRLRSGEPTQGVVAVLAALDRRLAVPSLPSSAAPWALAALAFAVLAWLLRRDPAAQGLGRLAAAAWNRTPPGQAAAQRRLRERHGETLRALRSRAEAVREHLGLRLRDYGPELTGPIRSRLEALDERREALASRPVDDPGLPADADRLEQDYALLRGLVDAVGDLETSARAPGKWVEEACASDGYAEPPPGRRRRGGRVVPVEELARLRQELEQLHRKRADLLASLEGPEPTELVQTRAPALAKEYERLHGRAFRTWEALYPVRRAAARKAAPGELRALLELSRRLRPEPEPAPPPAAARDSSDPPWADAGYPAPDGGSPSSDGGRW